MSVRIEKSGSVWTVIHSRPEARNAMDPFLVADDHSVWHQLHHEQPRAIVALHSPTDTIPIAQRFDEIWELSEPCALGRVLGL